MSKYTNKHGFKSRSLVAALKSNKGYDLKDIPENLRSVTTITDEPKAKILFLRHKDELTIDVYDQLWMMHGSAKHYYLELATTEDPSFLTEQRWFMSVEDFIPVLPKNDIEREEVLRRIRNYSNTQFLSGKMDCFDTQDKIIEDYKETKKGTFYFNPNGKKEWVAQVNIHAYVLRKLGYDVKGGRVVAILRDWSKWDLKNKDYPVEIKELDIPLWTDEQVEEYITNRVELFESMKKLSDDEIPPCSPEERWQNKGKDGKITNTRCEGNGVNIYCPQRGFCNFYRELVGAEEE